MKQNFNKAPVKPKLAFKNLSLEFEYYKNKLNETGERSLKLLFETYKIEIIHLIAFTSTYGNEESVPEHELSEVFYINGHVCFRVKEDYEFDYLHDDLEGNMREKFTNLPIDEKLAIAQVLYSPQVNHFLHDTFHTNWKVNIIMQNGELMYHREEYNPTDDDDIWDDDEDEAYD